MNKSSAYCLAISGRNGLVQQIDMVCLFVFVSVVGRKNVDELVLDIDENGNIICLDNDFFPFEELGEVERHRATFVEFDNNHKWWYVQDANTQQVVGTGFKSRQSALDWEQKHFMVGGEFYVCK